MNTKETTIPRYSVSGMWTMCAADVTMVIIATAYIIMPSVAIPRDRAYSPNPMVMTDMTILTRYSDESPSMT